MPQKAKTKIIRESVIRCQIVTYEREELKTKKMLHKTRSRFAYENKEKGEKRKDETRDERREGKRPVDEQEKVM